MQFQLIDVKAIAEVTGSYDAPTVEALAESMIEAGGLIRPLVLRRIGMQQYEGKNGSVEFREQFEVIEGCLEFRAAQLAQKIDPRGFEMVAAMVINPKQAQAVTKQLEVLNAPKTDTAKGFEEFVEEFNAFYQTKKAKALAN